VYNESRSISHVLLTSALLGLVNFMHRPLYPWVRTQVAVQSKFCITVKMCFWKQLKKLFVSQHSHFSSRCNSYLFHQLNNISGTLLKCCVSLPAKYCFKYGFWLVGTGSLEPYVSCLLTATSQC